MKPIKTILTGLFLILSVQFTYAIPQIIVPPRVQISEACKMVLEKHNRQKPNTKKTSFIFKASYGKLREVYPEGNHSPEFPINASHPHLKDKMGWLIIVLRQPDLSHKNIYFLTVDNKITLLDETT